MAFDFEIEQSRAVVGAVELVGDGLIDRNRDGPRGRLGLVAAVDGHRFVFHGPRRCLDTPLPQANDVWVFYPCRKGATMRVWKMRRSNVNCLP